MKIIKIGATWCTSCIIVKNNLTKVLKDYCDIELVEYDIDFDEEEVKKYKVTEKLPVLVFEKNEVEIKRMIGEVSKKDITNVIKDVYE